MIGTAPTEHKCVATCADVVVGRSLVRNVASGGLGRPTAASTVTSETPTASGRGLCLARRCCCCVGGDKFWRGREAEFTSVGFGGAEAGSMGFCKEPGVRGVRGFVYATVLVGSGGKSASRGAPLSRAKSLCRQCTSWGSDFTASACASAFVAPSRRRCSLSCPSLITWSERKEIPSRATTKRARRQSSSAPRSLGCLVAAVREGLDERAGKLPLAKKCRARS